MLECQIWSLSGTTHTEPGWDLVKEKASMAENLR